MRARKSIRKFFTLQTEEVNHFLRQNPKQHSTTDIHHMRVSVKKMRAVLSVAKLAGKEKILRKNQEPIDRLFAAAGKLRDLQLRGDKIFHENPKSSLPHYARFFDSQIQREKEKLISEQEIVKERVEKPLKKLNAEVIKVRKKDLKIFEKKIGKKKKSILKDKDAPVSNLHSLRKQVKKEQYLNEALNNNGVADKHKKMSDALGHWHDCRVMATEIGHDINNLKLPEKEVTLLKKFAQKQERRAVTLEKQIKQGKLSEI